MDKNEENTHSENGSGNNTKNILENGVKNTVDSQESVDTSHVSTEVKERKEDEKTEGKPPEKGFVKGDPLRSDEDDEDGDISDDPNIVLLDDDGDIDDIEIEDAPKVKQPKKPLGEILDDDGLPDFKEMLQKWGMDGLDLMEEVLCNMNVAIGGGHKSDYAINTKVKKAFYDSSLQLMRQKEIAAPTPMQLFLIALAAMVLPGLCKASFRRFTRPKPIVLTAQTPPNAHIAQTQETSQPPENYTDTPEYKENRTKFMVFGPTGCYQYRWYPEKNKFEYIKMTLSDEKPSEKIQKLIDEGKDNDEIKKILYGKG